ncbi:molecular chaperone [uncultured Desulfovibrio sp.]|uniref:molecular chaperone n=1 Tax=uncultured Desulfovibrio sp. TaxID=167968 RepID=UPI002804EBB0|nr:molecular chaperone [uncultured Desulfovibrio sp.]
MSGSAQAAGQGRSGAGTILGMDLGTSNTYLFSCRADSASRPEAVVVPGVSDAAGSMATAVLYEDGTPILIGNMAESEQYANALPGRVLRSQFKPEIAHGDAEAMRWMTDFLRLLGQALPEGAPKPGTLLYVGIPSLTREDFSLNLGRCFADAGWPAPVFVRESDAALISSLQSGALDIDDLERRAVILDFGGGTCDFTVLDGVDALANGGDPLYGGRLFDDLIFQVFCRRTPELAPGLAGSAYAYFFHWIECKTEKERFSTAMTPAEPVCAPDAPERPEGVSLHAVWYDAAGARRDAWVHGYTREDFIRDAENYAASPEMLAMLRQYQGRGGLSRPARDLLEGRSIGLVSWLRELLGTLEGRREVGRILLTGGSSRWFFVRDMAKELFPAAACAMSRRTYEDIAYGLALYPVLAASRARVEQLLKEKLGAFAAEAALAARALVEKSGRALAHRCTERIVARDIMPALEAAQGKGATVAALESAFERNIREDTVLLDIVREKSAALHAELQRELSRRFRAWLRENGVLLVPRFEVPAQAISADFFKGVSVRLSRLDSLNIMRFTLTAVLPLLAGTAAAGALAHTGEPVSTVLGGGVAFGGAWLLGRAAPGFLEKRKLPGFLLNESNRRKIVEKNSAYIEKALNEAFAEVQADIADGMERRLRHALESMLGRLSVLNQVRCHQ